MAKDQILISSSMWYLTPGALLMLTGHRGEQGGGGQEQCSEPSHQCQDSGIFMLSKTYHELHTPVTETFILSWKR